MEDEEFAALAKLYEPLRRLGPGSEAATRRALAACVGLPSRPRVLDLGCGTGASSLLLATTLNCPIEAVDLFPAFLARLRRRAEAAGLDHLILPRREDFGKLETPERGYDLLWSEGAAYNLGFEMALKDWRRLLAPGGFLALTEVVWLKEPPRRVAAFWEREYPGMLSRQEALERAGELGYRVLDAWPLAAEDWWSYYGPLRQRAEDLARESTTDPTLRSLIDGIFEEIAVFEESQGSYSYVFFVLQRRDAEA